MFETPPKYFEPRYFWKRREDGRIGVFITRIDKSKPHIFHTETGSVGSLSDEAKRKRLYPVGAGSGFMLNNYEHKPNNVGRANEKSASQVCYEAYLRNIKEKRSQGYKEADSLIEAMHEHRKIVHVRAEELPDLLELPREMPGFRPWKPLNRMKEGSKLWKRAMHGSAYFMYKVDGYGAIVVKSDDRLKVFSLRNKEHLPSGGTLLDRLPLVEWWYDQAGPIIPNNTMFYAEIIPTDEIEGSTYEYVTSIIKSSVEEALIKQDHGSYLGLYLWDVAMWAGMPIAQSYPYSDRFGTIMDICQSMEAGGVTDGLKQSILMCGHMTSKQLAHFDLEDVAPALIEPQRLPIHSRVGNPIEYAKKYAEEEGLEGFVVIDPDEGFGHHAWSLTGRPKRPSCAAKLKPRYEDDFIAMWSPEEGYGEYGKGKNKNRIGSIDLYQAIDKDTARFCGQCGSGLTDAQREKFMTMFRQGPVVVEVEFHRWSSKGKVTNPSFSRVRTDKSAEECRYSGPDVPAEDTSA